MCSSRRKDLQKALGKAGVYKAFRVGKPVRPPELKTRHSDNTEAIDTFEKALDEYNRQVTKMYWIIEGRIRLTGSLKEIHEGWLQQFVSEDGDLCEGANLLRLCDQKGDHRTDEGQEAIEKTLSELRLSPSPSCFDL